MKDPEGFLDNPSSAGLGALAAWFFIRIVTPHALDAIKRRDEQLEDYRQSEREENEELREKCRELEHDKKSLQITLAAYKAHFGPLPDTIDVQDPDLAN